MADKWVVQINEERQEARLDARKYDLSVRKHLLPKGKKCRFWVGKKGKLSSEVIMLQTLRRPRITLQKDILADW